ncbi:MAG TPA: HypC/HybG/HupF family hydrogenase formation chaperone [Ktedonobacterales bacterium]
MCLGIPGQVLEGPDAATHMAAVRVSGARRRVDVSLLDDALVEPGEWVLVHAGLAVSKISEGEALETLALLKEMSDAFLGEGAALDAAPDYTAPSS